jgi:hypothetical protein
MDERLKPVVRGPSADDGAGGSAGIERNGDKLYEDQRPLRRNADKQSFG